MDFTHPIRAVIPGVQGRVLAVLAETTAELNLRTLARLADVSVAQASRVLPDLVDLGLVSRREVPPSSQFLLNRNHVTARAILELSQTTERTIQRFAEIAGGLSVPPTSVIVFGSFARGEADASSDIDTIMIRPDRIDEEDESWGSSIEEWRMAVSELTGNKVEVVEASEAEATQKLNSHSPLWQDVATEGQVVFGKQLEELTKAAHA